MVVERITETPPYNALNPRDLSDGQVPIAGVNDGVLILDDTEPEQIEGMDLAEIDSRPGRVRTAISRGHGEMDNPDEIKLVDWQFESFRDARLVAGLLYNFASMTTMLDAGEYVPVEIAQAGKPPVASYLRVSDGRLTPRGEVAKTMGVSQSTVSNYWNELRYRPHEGAQDTVVHPVCEE